MKKPKTKSLRLKVKFYLPLRTSPGLVLGLLENRRDDLLGDLDGMMTMRESE
jgi:hypothetical protein